MRLFNFILLSIVITNGVYAQGVTNNGQNTTNSSNFVNKNGKIGSTPALTKNGQVLALPTLTTTAASSITNNSASSGGNISSDGGSTITARGVCWNTSTGPTITNSKTANGPGTGTYISSITGLTAGVTYYVRAYATNSVGTAYGNEINFTTPFPNCGTVTDIDGHVYNTVTIGTQCWMMQNLKVKHYRSGTAIPYVSLAATWSSETTGAYCYPMGMAVDTTKYGFLYNWYTVVDVDSLAPVGWHVATSSDYNTLITYLGNTSAAGGPMKEAGIADWYTPNTGATNSSGFTALPEGYRDNTGAYSQITNQGIFWTTTAVNSTNAYGVYLYYGAAYAQQNSYVKKIGISVRCVKN
jgi:uncharacterized protein (TIGR02145 family)